MEYKRLFDLPGESDRQLSFLGKLLLYHELQKLDIGVESLANITRDSFEKPRFAPPYENFHFSISHSRDIAIVAISRNQRVGIDIEYAERNDLPEPASIFTCHEQQWIGSDLKRYLTLWTKKEAVLKAEGKGLYHEPSSIEVLGNCATVAGNIFYCQNLDLSPEYVSAIAFEKIDAMMNITCLKIDDFFFKQILKNKMT